MDLCASLLDYQYIYNCSLEKLSKFIHSVKISIFFSNEFSISREWFHQLRSLTREFEHAEEKPARLSRSTDARKVRESSGILQIKKEV